MRRTSATEWAAWLLGVGIVAGATSACQSRDAPPAGQALEALCAEGAPYHPNVLKGAAVGAEAQPLGEGLSVRVTPAAAGGAAAGVEIVRGRTGADGRWCVAAPDGVIDQWPLVVTIEADGQPLRRLTVSPVSLDVSPTSEAIYQVLIDEQVAVDRVPREALLNLETVGLTAVDLLAEGEAAQPETLAALVAAQKKSLRADRRFEQKLAGLPKR